jgi:hypothetical protein
MPEILTNISTQQTECVSINTNKIQDIVKDTSK